MAVKFVPVDPAPTSAQRQDRENLAEVISLRSKITEIEERAEVSHSEVLTDATKILGRKAMSSGELRAALERRDHPAEVVEEVIANFESRKFLDDESLAEALCEKYRRTQHMSAQNIARKLGERRIPRDIIDGVVESLSRDEEADLMREVAAERARKLGSLERHVAERRLMAYMQRRGWGGSALMDVVREALDSADFT